MEFQSEAQKVCYEKVATYMRDLFGEAAIVHDSKPRFGVRYGSSLVDVAVFPWGEDDSVIYVRSYLVTGADLSKDLMEYLLKKNDDMRFGAFGLDDDGDIFFGHSIVGPSCDKNELKASVYAVLSSSDKFDDEIVSRWGGKRWSDRD